MLVLAAVLVIASGLVPAAELLVGVIVAAMLLAGMGLVVAPWVIRLYRTSQAERARAAAEAERADIAAHLHDSVLQTLAMIQKQKADPSAVEGLARGQERQLRSWLYRQNARATGTLRDQILAVAAELEEAHAVPVEVVSVGESSAPTMRRSLPRRGRRSSTPSPMPDRPASTSSPRPRAMRCLCATAARASTSTPWPTIRRSLIGWAFAAPSSAA
ncbi:hypothetical protein [Nesterenkonia pannonica]|uniref:hypothetical protein n=1 Tax=Nesterenkonia pannonica TaxID=1548602 RepID=UPI0021648E8A|nr:hypothetical protein [Nesterenkonia pannonica]